MRLFERRWLLSALLGSMISLPVAAQQGTFPAGELNQEQIRLQQRSQLHLPADAQQTQLQTQQRTRTQARENQFELGQARRSEAQWRHERGSAGGLDGAPGAAGEPLQGKQRSGGGRGR